MLLLKANPELKKVFTRLIGTVKAPVTWKDVFAVVNNNLILVGEVRSLIFNFDNKKVYTNIMDIPLENKKIDRIPNDALINNMLNMVLYAFGKWGSIGGLRVDKDYAALNQLFMGVFRPIGVEPGFRTENFHFYKNGIRITYEDVLQAAMELLKSEGKVQKEQEADLTEDGSAADESENGFSDETDAAGGAKEAQDAETSGKTDKVQADGNYEEEYELGLWHNMCWKMETAEFEKGTMSESDAVKSRIGNNFYMTDYQCPKCKEKLYMAVYPADKEILIETEEAKVFIARTYACNCCNALYTPRPGKLLQEGDVYSLNFDEDRIAYEDYLGLLGERAAKTVNYKFNEYASERGKKKAQNEPQKEAQSEPQKEAQSEPQRKERSELQREARSKLQKEARSEPQMKARSGLQKEARSGLQKEAQSGLQKEPQKENGNGMSLKHKAKATENPDLKTQKVYAADEKGESALQKNATDKGAGYEPVRNEALQSLSGTEQEALTQEKARLAVKTTEELKTILNNYGQGLNAASWTGQAIVQEAQYGVPSFNTTNLPDDIYLQAVKDTLSEKVTAKYKARMGTLDKLSTHQLLELKKQLQGEGFLSKEEKDSYIHKIDSRLYRAEEKAMEQKIDLSKNKTYEEINRIIEEVDRQDCPEELKRETISRLEHIRGNRAEREVEHLILHMPLHLDRKQFAVYLDKINQYKEVDLTPYKKQLEQRQDMAEKEEIAAFVKRGGSNKDRQTLWELYGKLQEQDYKKENKEPFLEKIYAKIRAMDEAKIEEVCPSVASLSFAEGVEAHDKISQMMLLPELKVNTLEMIERRLTKLKTDESVQLMRKLKHEMEEKMSSHEHFYFYDAREENKRAKREEAQQNKERVSRTCEEAEGEAGEQEESDTLRQREAMLRAVNGYAGGRNNYEYPLLVGDTTKAGNGKEGFVLTPDHIFYRTLLHSGAVSTMDVEKAAESKGIVGKGIYLHRFTGKKVKLPNPAGKEDSTAFTEIMDTFISYLQERPESRSISYLAREKHDVKCCYRCGFTYKGGNICPKCGSKMNN